jgi:hypothetical protein
MNGTAASARRFFEPMAGAETILAGENTRLERSITRPLQSCLVRPSTAHWAFLLRMPEQVARRPSVAAFCGWLLGEGKPGHEAA